MVKVVDLEKRLENRREKEHLERHRAKILAMRKLVKCAACSFRCAMCGFQAQPPGQDDSSHPIPGLALCETCRTEFEDFLSVSSGDTESDVFWHNSEWEKMWSTWLDYRKAVNAFRRSREFRLILEELDDQS